MARGAPRLLAPGSPAAPATVIALADSAAASDDSGLSWAESDFPGLGEGGAASDAITVTKLPVTTLPWVIAAAQDAGAATQIVITQADYGSYAVTAGQQFQLYTGQPAAGGNPPTARVNQNASFEAGTSPWTAANGASVAQSTLYPWNLDGGSHSCAMTPDGITANPRMNSEMITLTAGALYIAAASVTASAAWSSGAQTGLDWYDGATYLSTSAARVAALAAATQAVLQLPPTAPPQTATQVQLWAQAAGTPPAATVFYWDIVYAGLYNALLGAGQVYTITGITTASGYATVTFTPPAPSAPVLGTRIEQVA